MTHTTNILIVGVGGQGVVLASNILSEVALMSGFDVKKSEAHGQSQRSGSVSSHIRYGEKVHSPVIGQGEADLILAYEELEALRWAHYLKKDGKLILNRQKIYPPSVISGTDTYPADVVSILRGGGIDVVDVDGTEIATQLGNPLVISTLFIGIAASFLDFSDAKWRKAISNMVPEKNRELNLTAYERGKRLAGSSTNN